MVYLRRVLIAALIAALPRAAVAQADLQAMRVQPDPGLGSDEAPFWPDASYRSDVRSPSEFLGYALGSRPTTQADMVRYFEYLDGFADAELHDYGTTYEGRRLVYLVVASDANAPRLTEIQADCRRLADPRLIERGASVKEIIDRTPAVAWMAYGIHGDELSSGEAALQLAYQMVAGTDEVTRHIMDNCVVIIDPAENPDGRTRWLAQLAQWNGVITSYDVASMSHTGMWPYGRTNHYLFDLNRDWFALVHPETLGKTAAMLQWMPHYVLDCHEMGPLDTYLFSPPREPFNPHMTTYIHKWWDRVAREHAAQFDRFGWSYYTREWNEEMYPGYGSSWGIYLGAVGFLFEQAGVDGSKVKRPDGTVMSFRETVHHQFVGSMADLMAIADGRAELLSDYYDQKVQNLRSKPSTYVYLAGPDSTRLERFVEKLEHQKIEVERTTRPTRIARARRWDGTEARGVDVPAGSAVVRTNQPLRQLIEAILAFDNRISSAFLETERKEVLAHDGTRLYDATGWSMSLAYGLDAYHVDGTLGGDPEPFVPRPRMGSLDDAGSTVGFAFDGRDDRAFELLARLFEKGVHVWCARKPFKVGDVEFARGSFFIRRSGNPDLDVKVLRTLAVAAGVHVIGVDEGLARGDYADVGGNDFTLLTPPHIAIVGGSGINFYNFGAMWHLLDSRMRMRASIIDIDNLGRTDLSRYNVLVLPDDWQGVEGYKGALGDKGIERMKAWVRDGGTIVAEGRGAAFLADTSVAISPARMRRQVLKDLPEYQAALDLSKQAMSPSVDSLSLWENGGHAAKTAKAEAGEDSGGGDAGLEALKREDEVARKLAPRGTIVAVDIDTEHWLGFGCAPTIPVLLSGDRAFLTRSVEVPARFASADRLRLSGLLWPEAQARWSETAYAARDAIDDGQVILFTSIPNFRGYYYAAERLLLNALLLGPGMGTSTKVAW